MCGFFTYIAEDIRNHDTDGIRQKFTIFSEHSIDKSCKFLERFTMKSGIEASGYDSCTVRERATII